ncbi:MAG: M48 family metallopeptidase [Campylobacterales bacterium]|nr:M48 family metallopeptidase [Campylobacterales bacterium]
MNNTNSYEDINPTIIYNKRLKHTYISVDKEGGVTLKTPSKSQTYIVNLLDEKAEWIVKQRKRVARLQHLCDEILFSVEYIQDRVVYFSQEMGLEYSELRFKKMKSRWGSCNSKGVITLNTHLTRVKEELIDYVVVHELSHLVHMNHSKAFHTYVEKYLPNSKQYAKELKSIRLT